MIWSSNLGTITPVLMALSVGVANAENAKELTGFYKLVSIDNTRPDGRVVAQYGLNPKGSLALGANGRYVLFIRRSELPTFATDNVREGTAQENRAIVRGSIAHTGTYEVDAKEQSITFHIEASTFPNQDGATQKRQFTLESDDLKYVVTTPSVGSGIATLVWRRTR